MRATCVTQSCEATLFYAKKPATAALTTALPTDTADPLEGVVPVFKQVAMTPGAASIPTPFGSAREYTATIPAADVTTAGLLWAVRVDDGHVETYSPGIPYLAGALALEGGPIAVPELNTQIVGLDLSALNDLGGLNALQLGELPVGSLITTIALGDHAADVLGLLATGLHVTHPLRVLEPPHITHAPVLASARDVPLDISATSNCAAPTGTQCKGYLSYPSPDGDGSSVRVAMTATPGAMWTFRAKIPAEVMAATSVPYRITVSDGTASDTTPTFTTTTRPELAAGVISGRVWTDLAPYDTTFTKIEDYPNAEVTVQATGRGLDLTYGTADDTVLASTQTDRDGRYYLRGLLPGTEYQVRLQTIPTDMTAGWSQPILARAGLSQTGGVNLALNARDTDGDGLADFVERMFGLDPAAGADTDGDGLSDKIEVTKFPWALSPTVADTDGDGTNDRLDDLDGDGLTNLAEATGTTDPLQADGDEDGLNDAGELTAGTLHDNPDTDGDNLPDGFEVTAGTDPKKKDTDGDGLQDDRETLTSTVRADSATVALTGTGPLSTGLSITRVPAGEAPTSPGIVGPVRDITLDGDVAAGFSSARITLPYAAGTANADKLDVFYYDEDAGLWTPAASTFTRNTTTRTVTASVTHFSLYALINRDTWRAQMLAMPATLAPTQLPIDAVVVLDNSISMETNDPENYRIEAAHDLFENLLDADRGAVIDFAQSASVRAQLGSTRGELIAAAVSDIRSGTDIGAGVRAALDEIDARGDPTHLPVVFVVTDGEGAYDTTLTQRAVNAGVQLHFIDLGGTNEDFMSAAAAATDGSYQPATVASQIPEAMALDPRGDDDGDGLLNGQEVEELPSSPDLGEPISTDPTKEDTDGDGLLDGEEVQYVNLNDTEAIRLGQLPPRAYWGLRATSDPTKKNSDRDTLTDLEEFEFSDPLRADTDNDGLNDDEERTENTNPERRDTDGDGRSDDYELDNSDNGFDPHFVEIKTTKWDYTKDFLCGFAFGPGGSGFLGAVDCADSIPALTGEILSGILVFGDIRDLINSLIDGDIVNASLSVVAFIPIGGDAASAGVKVGKFAERAIDAGDSRRANNALRTLNELDDEAFDAVRRAYPDEVRQLQNAGVSNRQIAWLTRSNQSPQQLASHLSRSSVTVGRPGSTWLVSSSRFRKNWEAGEYFIRQHFSNPQLFSAPRGIRTKNKKLRKPDAIEQVPGGKPINHEAKTGRQSLTSRVRREIDNDCQLIDEGRLSEAVWHFIPGETPTGRLSYGPTGPLLDYIEQKRAAGCPIRVELHLPQG